MAQSVRVEGLQDLVRTFGKIDKELRREVQREIAAAARIVAVDARERASVYRKVGKIRERVRGATGIVEDLAKSRGIRKDFGPLLIRKAFVPALEDHREEVAAHIQGMLDRLGGENGF